MAVETGTRPMEHGKIKILEIFLKKILTLLLLLFILKGPKQHVVRNVINPCVYTAL